MVRVKLHNDKVYIKIWHKPSSEYKFIKKVNLYVHLSACDTHENSYQMQSFLVLTVQSSDVWIILPYFAIRQKH